MAELKFERIQMPKDGMDSVSPPWSMPATRAPVLENWLPDASGKLVLRGPLFEEDFDHPVGVNESLLMGGMQVGDKILFGERAQSATAIVEPWVANHVRVAANTDLTQTASDAHVYNLSDYSVAKAPIAVALVPGPQSASIGQFNYGLNYRPGVITSFTNRLGGQEWKRDLIRWNGGAAATNVVVYNNAPRCGQDIIHHKERLFILAGTAPNTTTIEANTLFFSDPVDPAVALPDTVAAWQDDVSGLTNRIKLDEDNDAGVALAKIGENLLILRRRSCYQLNGYSPSTFLVRKVNERLGCLDPRAVVEYENRVYFVSAEGLIRYDGAAFQNVSAGMQTELLAALAQVDYGLDPGATITCSYVDDGYIAVVVAQVELKTGVANANFFAALYNTNTGAWVRFSTAKGTVLGFGHSNEAPYVFMTSGVWTCKYITNPWRLQAVRTTWIDCDVTRVGAFDTITATWQSRMLRLQDPMERVQFHRMYLEFLYVSSDLSPPAGALRMALVGRSGEGIATVQTVSLDGTGDPPRRQFFVDTFQERSEAQIEITTAASSGTGGAPYTLVAPVQIFQAGVEYQSTHRNRSS